MAATSCVPMVGHAKKFSSIHALPINQDYFSGTGQLPNCDVLYISRVVPGFHSLNYPSANP